MRLAAALGTALKRGARVVGSRESARACRMIKRTMLSGLNSTGVDVSDLRVLPSAVARHLLKTESYDMGFHVGVSHTDPEVVQIRFFEQPGVQLGSGLEKEIEKNFVRRELRLVGAGDVGRGRLPGARARDVRAGPLPLARRATRSRRAASGSSSTTATRPPRTCCRSCSGRSRSRRSRRTASAAGAAASRVSPPRSCSPRPASSSARSAPTSASSSTARPSACSSSTSAARTSLHEQTLLLFLRLLGAAGKTGKVAVPVTVTHHVDRIAEAAGLEVVRTPALARRADAGGRGGGRRLRRRGRRRLRLPGVPARLRRRREPRQAARAAGARGPAALRARRRPAAVRRSSHETLPCPWSMKGTVMRVVTEQLKGRELDLTDGIKVFDERGWAQMLPDPDEPLVHIFAEGETAGGLRGARPRAARARRERARAGGRRRRANARVSSLG